MEFLYKHRKKIIFAFLWICMNIGLIFLMNTFSRYYSDFTGAHLNDALKISETGHFTAWNMYPNILGFLLRYLHLSVTAGTILLIVIFQCFYAIVVYYWLNKYLNRYISETATLLLTFISCIATSPMNPLAIAGSSTIHYVFGNWGGSMHMWHNPSSYMIRPFYVLTFFLTCEFLALLKENKTKLYIKWGILAFLLMVSVYAKVSWFQVFAPAVLIFLIISFVQNKFSVEAFKRCIILGTAFIPAGLYSIYTFFSYKNSAWEGLEFLFSFSRINYSAFITVLSLPLFTLICYRKSLKFKNELALAWLTVFVAYLQIICLSEKGDFAGHGNVTWGLSYANIILFIVSTIEFIYQQQKETSSLVRSPRENRIMIGGYGLITLYGLTGFLYIVRYVITGIYIY